MKVRSTVRIIPELLFNYYVRPGSKAETSNRNSFELTSRIIENHRELYQKHFPYIIAKKHEIFALNTNRERVREAELESAINLLWQKDKELDLIKGSKFWKARGVYLKIKHWLIFIFLNPKKFLRSLFKEGKS